MTDQDEKTRLKEEIAERVQRYIHIEDDGDTPSLMTGCVVIFESTMYDDGGNALFRIDYFNPVDSGVVHTRGLIVTANDEMHHRMFGHCGHDRD